MRGQDDADPQYPPGLLIERPLRQTWLLTLPFLKASVCPKSDFPYGLDKELPMEETFPDNWLRTPVI